MENKDLNARKKDFSRFRNDRDSAHWSVLETSTETVDMHVLSSVSSKAKTWNAISTVELIYHLKKRSD